MHMAMGELTAMIMGIHHMIRNNEILILTQMLSPSFPVGSFAYSHGMESAINEGLIVDVKDLEEWLRCLLTQGSGWTDAALLNIAYNAKKSDVEYINTYARAFASSNERIKETDLQGGAFCDAVNSIWDLKLKKLCYPVALARTAFALKLSVELTTVMFSNAFVANMCNVAMRLVPLGQTDGQRVQAILKSAVLELALEVKNVTIDDLFSNTFMSDIMAMRHETQYSRIFRT